MYRNMPVDLVLVRHGQSEGNLAQRLCRQQQQQQRSENSSSSSSLDRGKNGGVSSSSASSTLTNTSSTTLGRDGLITSSSSSEQSSRVEASGVWSKEFRERHNSLYRLTDKGRMQAAVAGRWIRSNVATLFDKYFTSEYVRAMETAAMLALPSARWATEMYLRERDRGVLANKPHHERQEQHPEEMRRKERDAFYWQPSGGESIANLCLRVDRVMENLCESCSGLRVIIVCHGGVIKSFRALIERVRPTESRGSATAPHQTSSSSSSSSSSSAVGGGEASCAQASPQGGGGRGQLEKIHNCQIVWYSRRDPRTGYISSKYNWVKSVCPWNMNLSSNQWREIRRHVYSNEELLRSVRQVPQLVNRSLEELDGAAALPLPGFLVLPDVSPSFSLDLGRASKQGVDKKSSFCANRSFHRRLFLSRQPTRPRGRRRRGRLDSTYGSLPLQHRRVSPSLSSLFLSQPHHPSNFKSSSSSLLYLSLSSFSQQVTFSGDAFLHSSQSPTSVLRERRRKWMEKNEQLSRLFMSPSPFSLTDFAQDSSSSPLGHHETPYDGDEDEDSSSSSPSFSGRMKGRGREEDPLGLSSSSSSSAGKRQGGEPFEGVLSNEELYQMYRQGYIYSEIEEEEESSLLPVKEAPFLIEGFAFNGTSPFASPPYGPMKRMVPYPRDLSFLPNLQHVDAPSPSQVKKKKEEEEERRRKDTDVEEDISHLPPSSTRDAPTPSLSSSLSSSREEVDTFLSVLSNRTKNWDFYGVPGSRYEIGNEGLLVTPPIFPNRVYYFTREEIQNDAYEDPYTDGSFVRHAEPSYLNPTSPALRTGRKRYLHRLSDTGKKQKKRWAMEEIPNDIPRGNWTTTND
ncbi:phosphoglycerate mutase family protein, partial [Cystoisospora suis]